MKPAPGLRLAAATGLVVTGCVALWWLGGTRLEIERGGDPGRIAAGALAALVMARALLLALLCPRLGALYGAVGGAGIAAVMLAPAWPAVVLAWSASLLPVWQVALAELALLLAAALLPALGQGLGRMLPSREASDLASVTAGALVAALLWRTAAAGPWPWG